jgi:hypothetical protein
VRGAVELTAGAAGVLEAGVFFRAVFFFAAARLRAAELVVFFFVLVWDERGAAVIDARRTTANIRSLRYKIDFCSAFMIASAESRIVPGECEFHTNPKAFVRDPRLPASS